jgi:hypothetical protein
MLTTGQSGSLGIHMVMSLEEVVDRAAQILEEERRYPTVKYIVLASDQAKKEDLDPTQKILSALDRIAARDALDTNRGGNPRTILQDKDYRFQFQSDNYELLIALLTRASEIDRPRLMQAIVSTIGGFPGAAKNASASFPSWKMHSSELPLVAEFLIRNGGRGLFIGALESAAISPGVIVLLLHLGDIIALNFSIFSESEYSQIADALEKCKNAAQRLSGLRAYPRPLADSGYNVGGIIADLVSECNTVIELCRKAGFLLLRSALKEDLNLEINQDKYVVQEFLTNLGFSDPLVASLNEAERLNHAAASPFELKASMVHLRSFMECLHRESIPGICSLKGAAPPEAKWGAELAFLRNHGIISKQEEQFVGGLFAVISDEAVHPIIAEREYARLARNVVIEYAVLYLKRLSKLGASKPQVLPQASP